jgi:nitroreductase
MNRSSRHEQPVTTEGRRIGERTPVSAHEVDTILALAGRAPSIHNTQPWRFRVTGRALELYADPGRRLDTVDPDGREMLISCGAALFGLRIAMRCLGYRPVARLLPDSEQPDVLARVELAAPAPVGAAELNMLAALRRRYTHRGAFTGEPLPPGLPVVMQRDAEAEGATLVIVRGRYRFNGLARLVAAADHRQRLHRVTVAQVRAWTPPAGSLARDGVPARAYPPHPLYRRDRLTQRDFDLGRGWGSIPVPEPAPATSPLTAVLTTPADGPADWLRAGQALHRLLLHAAGDWVFASIHTQPLEIPAIRAALRTELQLAGVPQMLLQFGRAGAAPLTPRLPVRDLLI